MPIKFLKKPSEIFPVKDPKWLLHNHLHGRSEHRGLTTVHASAVTKQDSNDAFCPRVYALLDKIAAPPADGWINTSEQVTFRIGNDLQEAVVQWYADMGRAVGHWKCLGCNHLHQFQPRPTKCVACGCRAFQHKEVRFESAKSGISCGIDMLINLGKAKLAPLECKTMESEAFKKLEAPLSEHRVRTTLYLRLIAESSHTWRNRVDTSEAHILYVSKGGYGVADPELKGWGLPETYSPFKRFTIKRNDKMVEAEHRLGKVVKDFRAGLVGMPHGVCHTAMEKRAQNCSACKVCFSGKFPPVYDWQSAE